MGGWTKLTYPNAVKTVEVYDPQNGIGPYVSTELPEPRSGASACALNGKIYLIGGRLGDLGDAHKDNVFVFDPATQQWTEKAPLPTAKSFSCAVAVDGKIYTIGGRSNSSIFPKTVEIYDPAADTWTTAEGYMPEHRDAFAAAAVDGKIYLIGGENSHDGSGRSTVFEYDPLLNEWTRKRYMSTSRLHLTVAIVGGKIYVMGGSSGYLIFKVNEVYDPTNDTWSTETDLLATLAAHSSAVYDNKIYVIGGVEIVGNRVYPQPYEKVAGTIYEFTPPMTSVDNILTINPAKFSLNQNYPNPFNPSTTIDYSLLQDSYVKLVVYNLLGDVVTILADGFQERGVHNVHWDASDHPSGHYIYRLEIDGVSATRKMLLQK
ncbi:T9SS type A sorting domain-containing protein, partial [candidate division KSB1 bacterium]|nr:T9SS type A sorting domain-containing protein [candidate division KSB1 bacterium]